MQPVPSAGKPTTDAKREKTYNRCQAQENMQPMLNAENLQPMPSAGKLATGAKRGKICNWCAARKNVTGEKRGKTYNRS